jgi:hypothetical protein
MNPSTIPCALALFCASVAGDVAGAQQPDSTTRRDSTRRAQSDSAARADSVARADSLFFAEQLQKGAQGATPGAAPAPAQGAPAATGTAGPTNPRLLPDVSAVGDLIADLSPKGSTQEDQTRFGVREVEVAIQAAVDPYFRGDVFLGLNDVEKVAIEQAYLTTTSLPYGLEVRLGRYLMPVGKENTTHRHDLHSIEYPYVIQRFFGPEGLTGTGLWVSKIFSPFGFYQELQVTAVDRFGDAPDGLTTNEAVNKTLSGLGYSARLRNYWDLTQAANVELGVSGITGRVERAGCVQLDPTTCASIPPGSSVLGGVNAVAARQTVVGADFTYRWRPLQQGLYKSFFLQAEYMRQLNEPEAASSTIDGFSLVQQTSGRDYDGGYAFARWQVSQRLFVGARYDDVKDPLASGATLQAGSGYLEFWPSEFSKLVAGYERTMPTGAENLNRIILQASFAVGPHKPHPF